MLKGINRANLKGFTKMLYESNNGTKSCIFISHKSEDVEAAKSVAQFIMEAGIDVYLDINDSRLQELASKRKAENIVECIEEALSTSTHILVLVTQKTKESWWVPYEVGYSKRGSKNIASLLLKSVSDFPDYLDIERKLKGKIDLVNYVCEIANIPLFEQSLNELDINKIDDTDLMKYIRK